MDAQSTKADDGRDPLDEPLDEPREPREELRRFVARHDRDRDRDRERDRESNRDRDRDRDRYHVPADEYVLLCSRCRDVVSTCTCGNIIRVRKPQPARPPPPPPPLQPPRSRPCIRCGKTGHAEHHCWFARKVCLVCGDMGHAANMCPSRRAAPGPYPHPHLEKRVRTCE